MPRAQLLLRLLLVVIAVPVLACGGDEPANVPTTGTLEVIASTSGAETDPDGYTVQVDAQPVQALGPTGSITNLGIAPGSHTVELGEVAANCSIAGENPRTINVPSGQTVTVSFSVSCSATTGAIEVMVATSGSPADPDGYVAKLDDREPGLPIAPGESASFTGVTVGNHTVELNGVASNCSVSEGASRTVRVTPGASSELDLAVTCTAQTGSLEITTATSGPSPDPDGYTVSVDGGGDQPVGVSATLSVANLAPGIHSVSLGGLAANCTVEGENPRSLTVTAGAATATTFTVSCPTPTPSPWTPMASGTTMSLTSVWGSSATDVFAVGEDVQCSATCSVETSILHFDGTGWSTALTQAGILRDVWAASASTDAFAVGADYPTYFATFLHNGGQGWSPTPSPAINVEGGLILGIWGSSASDVFAVGSLWPFGAEDHEAYVAHYDGTAWTPMQLNPGTCLATGDVGCNVELSDVWGSSPTDVYAVGNFHLFDAPEEDRAVILHYNGVEWSEVVSEPNLEFRRIWGSSANDVYVTGNTLVPAGSGNERGVGALWHFDGSSWSAAVSPTPQLLGAIWGSSPSDIYLLSGAQATSGAIWRFDGVGWTPSNSGVDGLLDVWGSSATDVFVVGQNGTILHGPVVAASVEIARHRGSSLP